MTDTNIEPESGASPAANLGARLRALRIRHNLSLIDVSDKLKIRSHVLNDMENGNFRHLKEGECLAYARYMGIDLAEVRAILAAGGSSGASDDGSRLRSIRTGIGIGALAVIAVGVVLLIASGGSDSKPEAEKALVSEPLRNGSEVLPAGEELNLSEISKGRDTAVLPEAPAVNDPEPPVIEPVPVEITDDPLLSGVQPGDEPPLVLPAPETPETVIPAAGPESGVITFDEELKAAGNLPDSPAMTPPSKKESSGKELSGKENRNPNAGYASRKPASQQNSGNPAHTRPASGKTGARQEPPKKPAPVQTTSRKPLRAGEVRSLADEMGVKKTAAPAKPAAPNGKTQAPKPAKAPEKPAKTAPGTGPRNLNSRPAGSAPSSRKGQPAALRSGEVRSLAAEQGRTTAPAGTTASAVKVRQVSGNGRVYDPDEVRRKADLVMKN